METFEIIKNIRTSNHLTQSDFGRILKCDRYRVADIERGKTTPTIEDIKIISKEFNISSDYLLGISDIKSAEIDNIAINKKIGLDDKSIKRLSKLKGCKYHEFTIFALNYIISNAEILNLITNYLFSFIFNEINKKPFSNIPLKISKNSYYNKIAFSDIIEKLPKSKDSFEAQIKHNPDLLQKFIYLFLCRYVDEKECNEELMREYGYSFECFDDYINIIDSDSIDYDEISEMIYDEYESIQQYELEKNEFISAIEKILEMKKAGETNGDGN